MKIRDLLIFDLVQVLGEALRVLFENKVLGFAAEGLAGLYDDEAVHMGVQVSQTNLQKVQFLEEQEGIDDFCHDQIRCLILLSVFRIRYPSDAFELKRG